VHPPAQPSAGISVVTPTFRRDREAAELLDNLARQTLLPREVILVDGAPPEDKDTEHAVLPKVAGLPFPLRYVRHGGGTAIQRNIGIQQATGEFIALIDDDIRLEPDFLRAMMNAFESDRERQVGGIVGYRTNEHFRLEDRQRWRWYRRLGLLTTYEPGRYDFRTGYPVNANMQPPFHGVRPVDFMTTSCAVWRREVFAEQEFDPFFRDYGMLEDAHFALRAGRRWTLWQCGDARCEHRHSPRGRPDRRKIGYKCVVNYYYVFRDVVRPLSLVHKLRFFRYQAFELFRIAMSGLRRLRGGDFQEVRGRLEGMLAVAAGKAFGGGQAGQAQKT
jgi:GT2 family glycosyltransferase